MAHESNRPSAMSRPSAAKTMCERAPHHGSNSLLLNGISTPGGYGKTSNPSPRLLPSSTRSDSNAMTRSTVSTTLVRPLGWTSIRMNGSPAGPSTCSVAFLGQARWPFTMPPVWGIWSIAASITGTHARFTNHTAVPATANAKRHWIPSNRQRLATANRATPPIVNGCQASLDRSSAIGAPTYSVRMSWETLIHPENCRIDAIFAP